MNTPTQITVHVTEAPPYTRRKYQATIPDWDKGVPIGYGQTIIEALEDFLESWQLKYDQTPKYRWS